jgi:hypothetical protein
MELVQVGSTNIAAIGYLPEIFFLRVQVHDGSIYDYPNCSVKTHSELMSAQSKGKYLHEHLHNGTRLTCHMNTTSTTMERNPYRNVILI